MNYSYVWVVLPASAKESGFVVDGLRIKRVSLSLLLRWNFIVLPFSTAQVFPLATQNAGPKAWLVVAHQARSRTLKVPLFKVTLCVMVQHKRMLTCAAAVLALSIASALRSASIVTYIPLDNYLILSRVSHFTSQII